MKWGLAACCVIAVAGWGAGMGVGTRGRNADAKADAKADADAKAKADADANADADARGAADGAVGIPDVRRAVAEAAIEEVAVEGDLPVMVVRGGDGRVARTVFLTGSCTTPMSYLRAFRTAAAEHGGVVALQGDVPCRDGTRRWSPDTAGLSARIEAALHAVGVDGAEDVTVLGYSQGAERAEWLAHRFPAKYTRFVLMAGPIQPSSNRFSAARAVAMLAGYGDVRENMANGAKRLRRSAIPAIYMELPGGTHHGELAPDADAVVGSALDWIAANATAASRAPTMRTGARSKKPTRPGSAEGVLR